MVKIKRSNFYLSPRLLSRCYGVLASGGGSKNYGRLWWFVAGFTLAVGDRGLIFASLGAIAFLFFIYNYQGVSFSSFQVLSRFFQAHNRRFTLAVAGSGISAIALYISAKIWSEIDSHWLASAIIFQGLISSGTFALFGWYFYQQKNKQKKINVESFEICINYLIAESPVQRLYGLNQIINLWEIGKITPYQSKYMLDYLLIMKNNEKEPIVYNRLAEFLNQISINSEKKIPPPPEQKPLKIPRKQRAKIIINN